VFRWKVYLMAFRRLSESNNRPRIVIWPLRCAKQLAGSCVVRLPEEVVSSAVSEIG